MNRRQSKTTRAVRSAVVRIWQMRKAFLLSIPYFLLLGWLYSGGVEGDIRPGELYGAREIPEWKAPDREHWFGTGPNGVDLFELSRHAMAISVSAAVVAVSLGIGLAALLTSLFVFDLNEGRFDWLGRVTRVSRLVPGMVVLVLFTGISGGSLLLAIAGIAGVVALHFAPVLARWFQEGEEGFDIVAARVLGLSRQEILRSRVLPSVLRRLPGVFATFVPVAVLAEMSLSFLGFTGERLSVGLMVAHGQAYLIEAPWMAVYPGVFATGVVLALSLLGWRVSTALRTGPLPRVL